MKRHFSSSVALPVIIFLVLTSLVAYEPNGLMVRSVEAAALRQEPPEPEGTQEAAPTSEPSETPTEVATALPTTELTLVLTAMPSSEPTTEPTAESTEVPVQPELTETVSPEPTPELTPELTDEPTISPFELTSVCAETGVQFAISNITLETAGGAYALVANAADLDNTEEPPVLEYVEFTLAGGETLLLTAGFVTPALVLDEEIYQLEAPCEEIIPPMINVAVACVFETGVSFTLTNNGGAMPTEQAYTLIRSEAEDLNGSFRLGANETLTLEGGYGTPTLMSGEIASTPEEICYAPANVSGVVWNDFDEDGLRGESESGITGVTVLLTDSAGFSLVATTFDDGIYAFGMLPTGSYTVSVDAATLAPHVILTAPVTSGGAVALDVLVGVDYSVDFGYTRKGTASVSGVVWLETANFSVRDANELGIVGVVVQLVDAAGTVVGIAPVDAATGTYQFSEVAAGDYIIRLDQTTLFTPNGMTWNSDETLDYETPVTLAADDALTGIDFGIVGTF